MPHITADDGVKLFYQETGAGIPVVFVHEFAGDWRSWEGQLRHFGRRYRCIAYNARGYPPSDVPENPENYSQARARDDIRAVLDGLNIDKAHVVGLSMGGFATLHFGFTYPDRARSLTIGGCGYGAAPDQRRFRRRGAGRRRAIRGRHRRRRGILRAGADPGAVPEQGPARLARIRRSVGRTFRQGSALTMRGVQARRPSLYDLTTEIAKITAPTLIMTGDEDWACLEPGIMMKKLIPLPAWW